jgi:hypothetical protein
MPALSLLEYVVQIYCSQIRFFPLYVCSFPVADLPLKSISLKSHHGNPRRWCLAPGTTSRCQIGGYTSHPYIYPLHLHIYNSSVCLQPLLLGRHADHLLICPLTSTEASDPITPARHNESLYDRAKESASSVAEEVSALQLGM